MEGRGYPDRIVIISGGQTGVDRAALDFCLDNGIRCGGWCPAGRLAEDGVIHARYPLMELPESTYRERTAANVRDSDGTVVLHQGTLYGGTLESFEFTEKEEKPALLLDMSYLTIEEAADRLTAFLRSRKPSRLNISGPRQSDWPEAYRLCYDMLRLTFLSGPGLSGGS